MTAKAHTALKPPLKWAGGKRWLIPALRSLAKDLGKRRLVEPFVGGMAVSLGILPNAAILADVNPNLINFYRWLKKGLTIDIDLQNERSFFLEKRYRFNELISNGKGTSKEAAALFYYLNRTCFNGLCRFNRRGEFNVPFGKYKTIQYNRDFSPFKKTLKEWDFVLGDFEELKTKNSDLLYVDPPYDVEFTQYSQNGFNWRDQERLVQWLSKQRCPIIASNQATKRIIELYRDAGFNIRTLCAPRRISCTGDRTAALEMLATKGL